jgi:hypothetical protein
MKQKPGKFVFRDIKLDDTVSPAIDPVELLDPLDCVAGPNNPSEAICPLKFIAIRTYASFVKVIAVGVPPQKFPVVALYKKIRI